MSTQARDLNSACLFKSLATPAANTATLTGTAVDCLTEDGIVNVIQAVGVVSGTNPTWAGKIQEGALADGSDAADITGATFTSVTASTNIQAIAFRRTKRYIRYVGTIGGTSTPTFNVAVILIGDLKQF